MVWTRSRGGDQSEYVSFHNSLPSSTRLTKFPGRQARKLRSRNRAHDLSLRHRWRRGSRTRRRSSQQACPGQDPRTPRLHIFFRFLRHLHLFFSRSEATFNACFVYSVPRRISRHFVPYNVNMTRYDTISMIWSISQYRSQSLKNIPWTLLLYLLVWATLTWMLKVSTLKLLYMSRTTSTTKDSTESSIR